MLMLIWMIQKKKKLGFTSSKYIGGLPKRKISNY